MERTQALQLIAIASGGALGAVARFVLSNQVYAWLGRGFPYGTLVVNVVGSLLMGLLSVWFLERSIADPLWRAAVLVGFLGAFTTFSTFSLETFVLIESGELVRAVVNMLASMSVCVVSVWVGVTLARQW